MKGKKTESRDALDHVISNFGIYLWKKRKKNTYLNINVYKLEVTVWFYLFIIHNQQILTAFS